MALRYLLYRLMGEFLSPNSTAVGQRLPATMGQAWCLTLRGEEKVNCSALLELEVVWL